MTIRIPKSMLVLLGVLALCALVYAADGEIRVHLSPGPMHVINPWDTEVYEPVYCRELVLGDVVLTEAKLQALLKLLDESRGNAPVGDWRIR